eukprot:6755114-Prymnesium_polylepis.3
MQGTTIDSMLAITSSSLEPCTSGSGSMFPWSANVSMDTPGFNPPGGGLNWSIGGRPNGPPKPRPAPLPNPPSLHASTSWLMSSSCKPSCTLPHCSGWLSHQGQVGKAMWQANRAIPCGPPCGPPPGPWFMTAAKRCGSIGLGAGLCAESSGRCVVSRELRNIGARGLEPES